MKQELAINYEEIRAKIEDIDSSSYYPKLLERYLNFDDSLTLMDYSIIYYGFSLQNDYLTNQLDESVLNDLCAAQEYEKMISKCNEILAKNPVSLWTNSLMGYALCELNRPESEWKKYKDRYNTLQNVIASSGDGMSAETAFKVIQISDEYDMLYSYFGIKKVRFQTLVGLCDKFIIIPCNKYNPKEIYFDISQNLKRVNELYEIE